MPFIDVKGFVKEWKEQLKAVMRPDRTYQLTVIQVGDNPASNAYIAGKKKDCEELGINFELCHYEENVFLFIHGISLLKLSSIFFGFIIA